MAARPKCYGKGRRIRFALMLSDPESSFPPGLHRSPPAPDPRSRFLEITLAARTLDAARALLDREWRYLGPLLRGRVKLEVLDLACGSGAQSLAWCERGARAVGLDFDLGLIAGAKTGAAAHCGQSGESAPTWVCADATNLPFRSRGFDVVFCNSLLEHVPRWRSALEEMARVLAPGGVAVVYTTNRHCPIQQEVNHVPLYSWYPAPIQRAMLSWIMKHRRDLVNYTDYPAIHWFTFPSMRRAFREAGLEPFDRIDLLAQGEGRGRSASLAKAMHKWAALKLPYYLYSSSMALYGVKRPA